MPSERALNSKRSGSLNGGRAVALEDGVQEDLLQERLVHEAGTPQSVSGRIHLPERRRRIHGCGQLPLPGTEAVGRVVRHSEAQLPGDAPDDGDAGPEDGIGERHPSSPAAFEAGHDGSRVHAGAAGKRPGDGRIGVRNADEGRRKSVF